MKITHPVFLFQFFLVTLQAFAQVNPVEGKLATDTADLTILNIYPDSFPDVSVIFKAETRKGEPCWGLTKEKMQVQENGQPATVLSIEPISKKRAVNLGIVIDHSGSMSVDESLFLDSMMTPQQFDSIYKNMTSPLENAKAAVKNFAGGFDAKKDFISVTGFSTAVSQQLALTQDRNAINAIVDSMRPDGSTALYDAMLAGLGTLKSKDDVNVLIVLTDGNDNSSHVKYDDVIKKAQELNVPVYIIGLGAANKDTLQLIANATKGKFYYTKKSSSLAEVYADIGLHIQAFYDLVYKSSNLASADSVRQVRIWFQSDSIQLLTNSAETALPKEVRTYLAKKETERSYMLYGGIAVVGLVAAGTLLYKYRKPKTQKDPPQIQSLYPNPSDGNITIKYSGDPGILQVTDMNGLSVQQVPVAGGEMQFDFSAMANGNYVVRVTSAGQVSNAVEFVVQK